MDHYFTDNRQLAHNRKEISFRFLGVNYTFLTDAGVFSKDHVDQGSLILLSEVCKQTVSGSLLDYGCGYGAVACVLKKQFDYPVYAVDVNSRAVELTKENAKRNNVEIEVEWIDEAWETSQRFSMVVLNPPIRAGKEVIYQMFQKAYDLLEEDGSLWIVIRKQHGAASAQKELIRIFDNCENTKKEKGFYVFCSKRK